MADKPTHNPGRTPCPPWCTYSAHEHRIHEGLLFAAPGAAAVTLEGSDIKPTTLSVWDQTETPYRSVQLDPGDALTLARILSALDPSDLIRFAAALAEGARVLGDEVEL